MDAIKTKACQNHAIVSVKATADFGMHRFITATGALCGAGLKAIGITKLEADSGEQTPVVTGGTAQLTIKAQLSAGNEIASDASGYGVLATAGDYVCAIAKEDGTADQTIEVYPCLYALYEAPAEGGS